MWSRGRELVLSCSLIKMRTVFYVRPILRLTKQFIPNVAAIYFGSTEYSRKGENIILNVDILYSFYRYSDVSYITTIVPTSVYTH